MKSITSFTKLPAFQKHSMLSTLTEQLGYLSIAAKRDELRAQNREARLAMHEITGIDAYSEMRNSEDEAAMDALFREDNGFDVVPSLPVSALFGAYKLIYGHMRRTQMFEKYPCRSLGEQIDSIGELQASNIDVKKLTEETAQFLNKQATDAGLDAEIMDKAYLRRKAQNQERKSEREDTLKASVMTEFANAFPEPLEITWDVLPTYAKWKILIACYKYGVRAAGALKADAESNVKNPWSNAAADYDAVVGVTAEIKSELEALQAEHGADLKTAFENKKLFENHVLA